MCFALTQDKPTLPEGRIGLDRADLGRSGAAPVHRSVVGRTDLANGSTAKCGWGDTSRPVDGHAVLKGLGLAVGWGLQKCISEEDGLLAGCCLLRGRAGGEAGLGEALGFTLVLFGDRT
jgi:hypothetical protein